MKLFLNKKLVITLSLVFLFGSGAGFYFNSIIKNSVAPAVAEDLRVEVFNYPQPASCEKFLMYYNI